MCAELGGPGRCYRCGVVFPNGSVRYKVDVRVNASTDGEIETVEELEKELDHLLKVIEGKDETELEQEVHTQMIFFLCRTCRDEYLSGPDLPLDRFFFGS